MKNQFQPVTVTIPVRLDQEIKGTNTITIEINKAIKATACSITRTRLTDKIRSEFIL